MPDLILGTAGHIDHGKTSLIHSLTGTNTDRLPEEKKRGITIELGFARLELPPYQLGIVDVPGHEKFVRQMLAGATGMDLVLLVVAGDDSVKQQTLEHLDILKLLDLPAGVIAITKCDLCDPDWLDLVEEEIRQQVAGTFLEQAPLIRTSAKSGLGLDELKDALVEAAKIAEKSDRMSRLDAPFRMAIDRNFTVEGHGTVVTGSVNSGLANVGDTLSIEPGEIPVRVRGIQNHDQSSDHVQRGQRAAINLAGIHHDAIERGQELCQPGYLVPSNRMTVALRLLDRMEHTLKDRSRVRFHVGTAELMGNIRLLQGSELAPGETAYAQVFLSQPAVATWNQPFVIRRESPVETMGGGTIVDPEASRLKKVATAEIQMLAQWHRGTPIERAAACLYFSDSSKWQWDQLSRLAGVNDAKSARQSLLDSGELIEVSLSPTRSIAVHRSRIEQLAQRLIKTLERMHREQPLRFQHSRTAVESEFSYLQQLDLLNLAIEELKSSKQINANVQSIGLVGYGPKLSKGQKALLEELIGTYQKSGIETPSVAELVKAAKKNKDSVAELISMAAENGDLVRINDEYFLHQKAYAEVLAKVRDAFSQQPELTMSELRQVLETSRKYAIPILEMLDASGVTIRDGDIRRLG